MKLRIKTGDDVIVLSGKYKGKIGRVERAFPKLGLVTVKGVNIVKRHLKPRRAGEKGVIVEYTKPIPASAVALVVDGKPTRVRYEFQNGRKVRVSVRTGQEI